MIRWFIGKRNAEVKFLLRVLNESDFGKLAEMYGEARDRFKDEEFCKAVDKCMGEMLDKLTAKQ